MLDIFCKASTENGNKKIKNNFFLFFNWSLFWKIGLFVQMTEIDLHRNSQKS